VKNRTSFRDTFAEDRRWPVRLIARPWTARGFDDPQSPDARIKQKRSTLGMTALSEQNGQRQITPPAVRNDDEAHQLGQSERCVPICSAESDASPGRPYLRTDAIESRDNSPSSF